jgi:hypothetical protein
MQKEFTFRNFVKDLGFRFLMAAAGIGVFVALALIGDFFEIELLQSPGGILAVLLVSGPVLLVSWAAYSYST